MKKLTIGLAVLLSGVASNSFAAVSAGSSPFNACVPSSCGGFNIGVTGYWWRPSIPHLDYALTFPAFTPDVIDPIDPFGPFDVIFNNGRHHDVDHDHRWGYRINVGYVFPCTANDVTVAYTHWDHDDTDHVDRGAGVIVPTLTAETLGGTILFDGTLFDFADLPYAVTLYDIFYFFDYPDPVLGGVPVDRASARSDLKYHAWDLEFGQYVSVGCNTRMRWFGGVRWAQIEHRFDATYSGALVDVDVTAAIGFADPASTASLSMDALINLRYKTDFNGVGPRFGLNTSYGFGCSGFGIVGEASGALLVGEIDSHFREFEHRAATLTEVVAGVTSVQPIVIDETDTFRHPDEKRVVPNLEAKLGVDYSYVFCNCSKSKLTVEAGYFVTHYFNTNDVLSDVSVEAPEFRNRHTIDTSFQGPYVSVQFQM